jgi:hypothetical protein
MDRRRVIDRLHTLGRARISSARISSRTLRGLALAATCGVSMVAAAAPPTTSDPLASSACRSALDTLQAAEDAQASQHAPREATPADARLLTARREAARACLAARPDPMPPGTAPPAGRLAQPPVRVAPVSVGSATAGPVARVATPPSPPVIAPPARPTSIVSCDAGGCWANDGSRLDRYGPALSAGSRGLCTLQGALLTCP